jgi:zinc protease
MVLAWVLGFAACRSDATPQATRKVLPNGVVLLHVEQRQLPLVTVLLTLRAGVAAEPAARAGLANLTAQLLSEGTMSHTAVELRQAIDRLGGRIGFGVDRETMTGSATVLRVDLEAGVGLLAEMLLRPTFPMDEFARRVQENIAQIERDLQDPTTQASVVFRKTLYGDHPYGRMVRGSAETLRALSRQDVVQFHQDYYKPQDAIVVVVGDVTQGEAEALLLQVFANWTGAPRPRPDYAAPELPGTLQVVKIPRDVSQARIIFGHPSIRRTHPDYYAFQVMNYILGGGGFESRLMSRIREAQGLAYSAGSSLSAGLMGGTFQAGFGTKNATASQAMQVLFDELQRIRQQPVEAQELADAKAFLTGSFPLQLAETRDLASLFTSIELFDLGLDYVERFPALIRAVTQQDVQRVARDHLHPSNGVLVILADLEKAQVQ